MTPAVVIGLGNVAMSDDGLGVQAVRELQRRLGDHPYEVALVEGGTAGLIILPQLMDVGRAIIVDAIDVGAPAGELVRMPAADALKLPAVRISTHEIGARDLLVAAVLLGADVEQIIVYGLQVGSVAAGTMLSEPVAAALNSLVAQIEREVRSSVHEYGAASPQVTLSPEREQ
jgi:hydrogenase maturation protease